MSELKQELQDIRESMNNLDIPKKDKLDILADELEQSKIDGDKAWEKLEQTMAETERICDEIQKTCNKIQRNCDKWKKHWKDKNMEMESE